MAVRLASLRAWLESATPSVFATLVAVLALGAALLTADPAAASNPRYSALVMNAETGDVIYSRNADSRRYPASLTKVMTLYLLFEAIEEGRLSMDDELSVSARAAGQPPSKLGVEAGSTITVSEAIQALAVRSANDVAVVVGEALAGSEWEFGRMMTRRAAEMGMDHTRFENASGLPHRRQQTTARDLAAMAMHMVQDFPQHLHYFSQRSFTYQGRTWQTHNHLLENYPGTTGMKTGYIRASGFNLITTVERDGISLVGIVLGGRTAGRRDTEMERLLDLNFARLAENPHFGSRVFASNIQPQFRPDPNHLPRPAPTGGLMANVAISASPSLRPTRQVPTQLASLPSPERAPATASATAALVADANVLMDSQIDPLTDLADSTLALADLGQSDLANNDPALRPSINSLDAGVLGVDHAGEYVLASLDVPEADGVADYSAFRAIEGSGGPQDWGIHVGRFGLPEHADVALREVAVAAPTMITWGMAAVFPDPADGNLQFDAGFGPMTEDEAIDACASLTRSGIDCHTSGELDWDMALRR